MVPFHVLTDNDENIVGKLRPGLSVDVLVGVNVSQETTDVRKAMIYDIDGKEIILAQTTPAFTSADVGKKLIVTCLLKQSGEVVRAGISCELVEIKTDYQLYSSESVQAVIIKRVSGLKKYNLRMFHRVRPGSRNDLVLYVEDERVDLNDVSIGGANFSWHKKRSIKPHDVVKLTLVIDGETYSVQGSVVRVSSAHGTNKQNDLETIAVQFLRLGTKLDHLLCSKIIQIERTSLT